MGLTMLSCIYSLLLTSILTPKSQGLSGSYRSSVFFSRHADDVIVDYSDVISWSTARSTSKCSSRCLDNVRCVSFLFDRNTSYCYLLSRLLPVLTSPADPVNLHGRYYVRGEATVLKSTAVISGGREYSFIFYPLASYFASKEFCESRGSSLFEINSQSEWTLLQQNAPSGIFFTGATDKIQRGVFAWETTGQPIGFDYTTLFSSNQTFVCILLGKLNIFMELVATSCLTPAMFACEKEMTINW